MATLTLRGDVVFRLDVVVCPFTTKHLEVCVSIPLACRRCVGWWDCSKRCQLPRLLSHYQEQLGGGGIERYIYI